MKTTVTLDKTGRVVIPKAVRDELRLEEGDELSLESDGELVTLRPVRCASPLRKEHGVWVFRVARECLRWRQIKSCATCGHSAAAIIVHHAHEGPPESSVFAA